LQHPGAGSVHRGRHIDMPQDAGLCIERQTMTAKQKDMSRVGGAS
jgi:hypothetical protein